jgi:hypothetical protein
LTATLDEDPSLTQFVYTLYVLTHATVTSSLGDRLAFARCATIVG